MKRLIIFVLVILFIGCWGIQANETKNQEKEGGRMKLKPEGGIGGIAFYKTQKLEELKDFYINQVGATMWMDQGDCAILRYGDFLFGFCQREKPDLDGIITFFYEKKEDVDRAYAKFKDTALAPLRMNPNYPIYNFFARDPEGRTIEFQYFTGPIDWKF